jgi:hypothetical protein
MLKTKNIAESDAKTSTSIFVIAQLIRDISQIYLPPPFSFLYLF